MRRRSTRPTTPRRARRAGCSRGSVRRAGRHRLRRSRPTARPRSWRSRSPAAGVPVTSGVTVTDRLSRSVKTGIVTRAVAGETSIGRTAFPTASTAMSGTSWSKSRPPGSIATSARTDATRAIWDSGPDTVTLVGIDRDLAELQAGCLWAKRDLDRDDLGLDILEPDADEGRIGGEDGDPRVDRPDRHGDARGAGLRVHAGQVDLGGERVGHRESRPAGRSSGRRSPAGPARGGRSRRLADDVDRDGAREGLVVLRQDDAAHRAARPGPSRRA